MSRPGRGLTLGARCFAVLSRAFPRPISERYGTEMLDAFVRERDLVGVTEGHWPAFRFSVLACLNVAKEGFRARGRAGGADKATRNARGARGDGPKRPYRRRWSPSAWLEPPI